MFEDFNIKRKGGGVELSAVLRSDCYEDDNDDDYAHYFGWGNGVNAFFFSQTVLPTLR